MERIVIVGYKPHEGKASELVALSLTHWDRLNKLGLVSERKPILMQSANGTVIEVFGWKSKEAMTEAHSHPEVLKMWEEYAQVCEYVPAGSIQEMENLFSEFSPLE